MATTGEMLEALYSQIGTATPADVVSVNNVVVSDINSFKSDVSNLTTKTDLDTAVTEMTSVVRTLSLAGNPSYYTPSLATRVIGDNDGGILSNLATTDLAYFDTGETTTDGIDVIIDKDISEISEVPTQVKVTGYYNSKKATHQVDVFAWDYLNNIWDLKGSMQARKDSFEYTVPLNIGNSDSVTGAMSLRFLHNITTYDKKHVLRLDSIIWEKVQTNSAIAQDIAQVLANQLEIKQDTIITSGYAQGSAGNCNQIQLSLDASSVDSSYDPSLITITSGPCTGQSRIILQYDGITKIAILHRDWVTELPTTASRYSITAYADTQNVNEGLMRGGTVNTVVLNERASNINDTYVGQLLFLVSGPSSDQANLVIAYDGSTKIATLDRDWVTLPTDETAYVMIPASPVLLSNMYEKKTDADIRQSLLITAHETTQTAIQVASDTVPTVPEIRAGFDENEFKTDITGLQASISNIPVDYTPILSAIDELHNLSLLDVEGSLVIAKQATLDSIVSAVALIPTDLVSLVPVLDGIVGLNNVSATEVRNAFNEVDFKDRNTELEVHTWLDTYSGKNSWKADATDLTGVNSKIDGVRDVVDSILTDTSSLEVLAMAVAAIPLETLTAEQSSHLLQLVNTDLANVQSRVDSIPTAADTAVAVWNKAI